jgi:hypothetical protein
MLLREHPDSAKVKIAVNDWIGLVTVVTTAAASALALWYSHKALKRGEQFADADLILRLEEEMRAHQQVHIDLRPGGRWANGNSGPTSNQDWASVEDYMGLFEVINVLVDKQLLGMEYVEHLHGYRYDNLVKNPVIRQAKLVRERDGWKDFIALGDKLATYRARR